MITFRNSSSVSVVMPNPILGDSDQFDLGTIYKITMAKTIHSTKQNKVLSTFLLTFDNVIQSKYEEFIIWFKASRGLVIVYTDYNNVDYTGIIKNEPIEVTIDGRRYCNDPPNPVEFERASITIEFEAQR